ncbi:MAG: hypothetical protein EBV03_03770 [Proteobacteria bacterium]|nr:hypothetical protein [Pseudomonadota bacterium]
MNYKDAPGDPIPTDTPAESKFTANAPEPTMSANRFASLVNEAMAKKSINADSLTRMTYAGGKPHEHEKAVERIVAGCANPKIDAATIKLVASELGIELPKKGLSQNAAPKKPMEHGKRKARGGHARGGSEIVVEDE